MLHFALTAAMQDKTDLGFSTFAGAAFLRAGGEFVVASQRMSPNRSFAGVDSAACSPFLTLRFLNLAVDRASVSRGF